MYKVISEFVDRTTGTRWKPARRGDPPVYYNGKDADRYVGKGCLEAVAPAPKLETATAGEVETADAPKKRARKVSADE
jgi:hypothetical protein